MLIYSKETKIFNVVTEKLRIELLNKIRAQFFTFYSMLVKIS